MFTVINVSIKPARIPASGKREREVEVGDVVVVFEEERKRGEWKMGVVERLVIGRDNVVRGATVRVVTKGKPIRLSRPVQKLYPLEFRSEGERIQALTERNRNEEIPTRRVPPRNSALDLTWKSRLILDS